MIIIGSATVPSSSTVPVFTLPSGLSNFTLYQPTVPQPVFIGPSTAVSAANGMPVSNTPLNQETYVAGKGLTFYATTGNNTASSFQFIICTAAGLQKL